jgi:hypothetical protein
MPHTSPVHAPLHALVQTHYSTTTIVVMQFFTMVHYPAALRIREIAESISVFPRRITSARTCTVTSAIKINQIAII